MRQITLAVACAVVLTSSPAAEPAEAAVADPGPAILPIEPVIKKIVDPLVDDDEGIFPTTIGQTPVAPKIGRAHV